MSRKSRKAMEKVDIHKRHPNLYYLITVFCFMNIALGFNFFFTTPTFTAPLGIPKTLIASIFMFVGISKLFFLNVSRNLKVLRALMAFCVGLLLFWGLANTQQFFAGKASLQLPLLYVALAFLQFPVLIEPAINPVTQKIKTEKTKNA